MFWQIGGPDPQGITGKRIPNPFYHQEGALLRKEGQTSTIPCLAWTALAALRIQKNSNPAAISKALSSTSTGPSSWLPHPGKNMYFPLGSASGTSERQEKESWTQHFTSSPILCVSEILHLS